MGEPEKSTAVPVVDGEARELFFQVPGGVIAGQEWRPTEKPKRKVLLLPGQQDSSNSFKLLVPLLPRDWWMVAIEFSGDGFSSRKPIGAAYHSTDRLLDVKRVVKKLGWKKYTLIGHGTGAGIGQVYSALFPEEIETLVSLDVVKQVSENPTNTVESLRKAYHMLNSYQEDEEKGIFSKGSAIDWFYENNGDVIPSVKNSDLISRQAVEVILERNMRQLHDDQYVLRRDPRLLYPSLVNLSVDQHRELYNAIKVDHLLIRNLQGPGDQREPARLESDFLEIYENQCPRFAVAEIDGPSYAHLDMPELIAPLIIAFLGLKGPSLDSS